MDAATHEILISDFGEVLNLWGWHNRSKAVREAQVQTFQEELLHAHEAMVRFRKRERQYYGPGPSREEVEEMAQKYDPPPWLDPAYHADTEGEPGEYHGSHYRYPPGEYLPMRRDDHHDDSNHALVRARDPWHNPDPFLYGNPFDVSKAMRQSALRAIRHYKEGESGRGHQHGRVDGAAAAGEPEDPLTFEDLQDGAREASCRFEERHHIQLPGGFQNLLELWRRELEGTIACDLDAESLTLQNKEQVAIAVAPAFAWDWVPPHWRPKPATGTQPVVVVDADHQTAPGDSIQPLLPPMPPPASTSPPAPARTPLRRGRKPAMDGEARLVRGHDRTERVERAQQRWASVPGGRRLKVPELWQIGGFGCRSSYYNYLGGIGEYPAMDSILAKDWIGIQEELRVLEQHPNRIKKSTQCPP
jgi:hypothetical protein